LPISDCPFPIARLAWVLVLSVSALVGCSRQGGSVRFDSTERKLSSTQRFSEAYLTRTTTSEIEIVLVEDAVQAPKPAKKNQPIQPVKLPPLRQVMRIHMYWRPMTLTSKNPAAINASVDWYVLGAEGSEDVMSYEGAAFVVLEGSGDTRDVRIKDGQIHPKTNNSEGRLVDPVGPSRIQGEVVARISKAKVEEALKELAEYGHKTTASR
jgi:hypothetical protein